MNSHDIMSQEPFNHDLSQAFNNNIYTQNTSQGQQTKLFLNQIQPKENSLQRTAYRKNSDTLIYNGNNIQSTQKQKNGLLEQQFQQKLNDFSYTKKQTDEHLNLQMISNSNQRLQENSANHLSEDQYILVADENMNNSPVISDSSLVDIVDSHLIKYDKKYRNFTEVNPQRENKSNKSQIKSGLNSDNEQTSETKNQRQDANIRFDQDHSINYLDSSSLNANDQSLITQTEQELYVSGIRSPYVQVPVIDYSMLPRIASKIDKITVYQFFKRGQITDQDRRYIWLYTTGALNAMASCHSSQSYSQILRQCNQDFPNPNFRQIKVDLNRTFQDEVYYKDSRVIQAIENVLRAYSVRNPTIGYCQGFNFIVGRLLLVVNEEEAFWMFCMIIETMLPLDYYSNMVGALIDQKVFSQIFDEKFPHLYEHLLSMGCDPSLITFQWFACFFSYNVPFHTLIRIWDLFFLKGMKILFRISLAIMDQIYNDLIDTTDFQHIFKTLDMFPSKLNDFEVLMQIANKQKYKITQKQINQFRQDKRPQVIEEIQNIQIELKESINSNINRVKFLNKFYLYNGIAKQMDQKVKGFDIQKTEHLEALRCDKKWAVCLFDFTYKNKVPEYFAFRVENSNIYIHKDYFYGETVQGESQMSSAVQIDQYQSNNESDDSQIKNGLIKEESDNEALCSPPPQQQKLENIFSDEIQIEDSFNDSDLLIERNHHYCSKSHIEKFKQLLRKNDIQLYTSDYLNFRIDNDVEAQQNIKLFIKEVNTISEENHKIQNLLKCLKRSNSDYTQVVPISRTRANSHEDDEKFKFIRVQPKTPYQTHQDKRLRTKSGKLGKQNHALKSIKIENFKGDQGNLEICTLACLFRNLNRKQLEKYIKDMRVKRLEIFDTFLKGFDDSGEKYASNFNSTPINKHE